MRDLLYPAHAESDPCCFAGQWIAFVGSGLQFRLMLAELLVLCTPGIALFITLDNLVGSARFDPTILLEILRIAMQPD